VSERDEKGKGLVLRLDMLSKMLVVFTEGEGKERRFNRVCPFTLHDNKLCWMTGSSCKRYNTESWTTQLQKGHF
jgi:hypothetical protein